MFHPVFELPPFWIALIDFLLWPTLQLSLSYLAFKRPLHSFDPEAWLYRTRPFEKDGLLYRNVFQITTWKRSLPDGAALFPGQFRKTRLAERSPTYLRRFLVETCRGEWAHLLTLAMTPIFFLWNPPWACAVMIIYSILTNVPCILVQRHNRIVFKRLLKFE